MFLAAVIGWVFFRSANFGMAASLLNTMFVPTRGAMPEGVQFFLPLALVAAAWSMTGPNAQDMHRAWRLTPARALVLSMAAGACIAVMAGGGQSPFLYFQF
jgi:hypothetical protein